MDQKINTLFLEETVSTNTYLKERLLAETLDEGFTVCADFQTAGRGQRGNNWEANSGENLLFSMVLFPKQLFAEEQFMISEVVSLALKDVLSNYVSDISIKWPNDIYWNNKKIAGILIEHAITGDRLDYSIIGVGLNVNQTTFESDAPNPVSLKQITGITYSLKAILTQIQECLFDYYQEFEITYLHLLYKKSLFWQNGCHWFSDGKSSFMAQIEDIRPNGALCLKLNNASVRTFSFKEIKFLIDK